jgi:transaldolase
MPAKTLQAFADHGRVGAPMAADGGDAELRLRRYAEAGIDVDALASRLQEEGAAAFVKSWRQLMQRIADKAGALA